jgi:hypothetical protein
MRHLTMISLTTALAVATAAPAWSQSPPETIPPVASTPVQHSFEHWRAACDNGGRCFAWNAADDAQGWIRISLSAGPDARPAIAAGAIATDPATPTGLRIDNLAVEMTPSTLPDSDWVGTLEGEAASLSIKALAGARTAHVTGGNTPLAISLTGFSQSLSWIDQQQGRARTVTALFDPGLRPASTVPSAPALPHTTTAATIDQTGFGGAGAVPASVETMPDLVACRDSWGEMHRPPRPVSARLGAATELWGLACSMTTYNTGYLLYLTGPDGRDPRRLVLPGTSEATDIVVNPDYDPATRTLTQSLWDNKWGHCGRLQTWVWTGSEFTLQTEQAMADCTGMPPPFWPTLWRTR